MTTAANLNWIFYHFKTNSTFPHIAYRFLIFKPFQRITCVFRNSHVAQHFNLKRVQKSDETHESRQVLKKAEARAEAKVNFCLLCKLFLDFHLNSGPIRSLNLQRLRLILNAFSAHGDSDFTWNISFAEFILDRLCPLHGPLSSNLYKTRLPCMETVLLFLRNSHHW